MKKFTQFTDVFKNLSNEERELLENCKHCKIYKKGEILYKEGSKIEGIYFIEKGVLKIYKRGNLQKPQIVAFARKGDIMGYRSALSYEPACTTVEVIEEADICLIPTDIILGLIKENSDFALTLIQVTCKELDQANMLLTDFAQKSMKERVAEVLLMLHDTFNTDSDGFIQINLTRRELANIVGNATESVIRILTEFKTDKLIDLNNRKIKITNYDKLKFVANSIFFKRDSD